MHHTPHTHTHGLDGPAGPQSPELVVHVYAPFDGGPLGLSVVIAPAAPDPAAAAPSGAGERPAGFGWAAMDARWERVIAPWQSELLDEARIYQGLLPTLDVPAHYPHAAGADLARAVTPALPVFPRAVGWESRGASTLSGCVVWEPAAGHDHGTRRRLLVLAGAAREASLGAWTWSSGDTAAPPLALYLAQAAKPRLQGRLWSDGTATQALRRHLDDTSARLASELITAVDTDTAGSAAAADVDAAGGDRDRRAAALRRNVEVAATNLRALTSRDVIPTGHLDPFEGDLLYARYLAELLTDGEAYLRTAQRRAREVLHVYAPLVPAPAPPAPTPRVGSAASAPAVRLDLPLSGEDRLILLDELAVVFAEPTEARQFVADIGVPRGSQPVLADHSPRVWWGEVFHLLAHGIVGTPYRALLVAALRHRPYNETFRAVAQRYDVVVPTGW
ncbi:CATRA conflict system CASPASE/TPR repeat-associated protein [Candidatus Frankia nodulisporulans]|uniref:CATRA conflict system CASPASE/TPR repeat-associated protein n=2 Tax=Candidatus Frankia nodulisporulans TaxID=2060052 RepID=UPI0013D661EF|nr:CATRA conflict system CASPASE/TPR repeat-associated protein [Candidatus Frankia nodulisporulans]